MEGYLQNFRDTTGRLLAHDERQGQPRSKPAPLLTYGYRGTGVDNLRAFLREAGLDGDALAGIDDSSWEGVSVP